MTTYKHSKLYQTELIVGLWSEFICRSTHTWLQVYICSGCDLYHPG